MISTYHQNQIYNFKKISKQTFDFDNMPIYHNIKLANHTKLELVSVHFMCCTRLYDGDNTGGVLLISDEVSISFRATHYLIGPISLIISYALFYK